MKGLLAIPLFLLGVHLGLRTVVALYRVRDLWYTIGTAWPRVLRGIAGWGGGTAAVAALLPDRYRPAFLWGVAFFIAFHLGTYAIRFLVLQVVARRRANASAPAGSRPLAPPPGTG